MKKLVALAGILFFSIANYAQKITDDFTGKWKAPKGAIIVITKSKDGFIGKTKKENATVLKNVKFFNGIWTAIVLNPKEHIVANCELTLEKSKLKIVVRKGVFYKTIVWVKQ